MDVVDLRNFYAQRLGVVARRFVGDGIRGRWSDMRGLRLLGVGYATPYLGLFREEAERCLAMMPAPLGVVRWPSSRPALAALVEEDELPLTDSAGDRVLLVHALEMSPDPQVKAWSLVYLGKLSDISGDREQARKNFEEALSVPGISKKAREEAEKGMKQIPRP